MVTAPFTASAPATFHEAPVLVEGFPKLPRSISSVLLLTVKLDGLTAASCARTCKDSSAPLATV